MNDLWSYLILNGLLIRCVFVIFFSFYDSGALQLYFGLYMVRH